jgi:hypothetical protein
MLTIDVPLTAGIGYAVLGGAVTTGVLVFGSLLLHAANNIRTQSTTRTSFLCGLCVPLRSLRRRNRLNAEYAEVRRERRVSDLFVAVILDWINLILFVWERFTGHAVFTFNPPAKVDELAAFSAEGAKGVVFPLGRLTAGWASHQSRARTAHVLERCRSFDQYSSFDECDRTCAAHGIQADGDTFSG